MGSGGSRAKRRADNDHVVLSSTPEQLVEELKRLVLEYGEYPILALDLLDCAEALETRIKTVRVP